MSGPMDLKLLWLIQLAPLAAFLFIQLLPASLKKTAPLVGILGALAAAASASALIARHASADALNLQFVSRWLVLDANYVLVVGFLLDRLNLLMIWLVTVIAFFVQVFSAYYMEEDRSRARYFAFLSFFSFSMTGLVLSNNLLQTFLFWELVGLTSYLLIGFWFEKPSAATAARKAFVINRLADLGFYLGIILLFIQLRTLNFTDLNSETLRAQLTPEALTLASLLVFCGVMGKSAQFPFHNWLPDAMEGPTPVSALIHSATMVAAGVFLLARAFPLFAASAQTLVVILSVGAVTAFVGAALATAQRDIKKIMAYSTISQLGLMVMAIGAGSHVAGMFHLSTHAFFKSLLFLTAGAFIHRYHTNDIWEIGRKGGKNDKLAFAMLLFGLASLSGLPPFAGFFSKDLILETLKERSLFFFGLAVFVSFLTVYYSCRMIFIILFSKTLPSHQTHAHASAASRWARALPLVCLAAISLVMGFLGSPLAAGYSVSGHRPAGSAPGILAWLGAEHPAHFDLMLTAITLALIAAGVALAYLQFKDPEAAEKRLAASKNPVSVLLERKFFVDDIYYFFTKRVGLVLAAVLDWFDRHVINEFLVNGTSYNILKLGRLTSRLQDGALQDYLSLALLAGALVIFFFML